MGKFLEKGGAPKSPLARFNFAKASQVFDSAALPFDPSFLMGCA